MRVYASGITGTELTWDQTYRNPDGSPRIPTIPGHELSGVVEYLAPGATGLARGDAVYGLTDFPRDGAAAEYVAVRAANLALKPGTTDHVHSAAVTLSGLTAWQALFSGANLDFPGGLGADETIDYTKTRFEDVLRDIDVVLDAVGGDIVERSGRVLRRERTS